ncbi:MAG: hypothetical protein LBE35_07020 [Clostridiales bacterium]|nr:hypothetical protein [Clostridiales bacterium]
MFTKILKYDFKFSAKIFFAMFAGMIVFTGILRLSEFLPGVEGFGADMMRLVILMVGVMAVAIASYLQILLLYQRNFFGPEGYLMLTLPVNRGRLLASKFLVSMVWFNFMMLVVPIMVLIIAPPRGDFWTAISNALSGNFIVNYFQTINLLALALISILFLTVTLANSVFFGKKVHGVVAGIFSAAYHFLFFLAFVSIDSRFAITEVNRIGHPDGWSYDIITHTPQIGLQYGRIPFEFRGGGFIDIFSIGFVAAFVALTVLAIMYLLKKRVALR